LLSKAVSISRVTELSLSDRDIVRVATGPFRAILISPSMGLTELVEHYEVA